MSGRVRNFYYSLNSICLCFRTRWSPLNLRIHQTLYFTYNDSSGSHSCWELHFSDDSHTTQSTCCRMSLVGNTPCNLLEKRINAEVEPHMPSCLYCGTISILQSHGHLRRWTWVTATYLLNLNMLTWKKCLTKFVPLNYLLTDFDCHWSPKRCHASPV